MPAAGLLLEVVRFLLTTPFIALFDFNPVVPESSGNQGSVP